MAFTDYLSRNRMTKLGFTERRQMKDCVSALKRISESGNMTKHSGKAGAFNGAQLINDFDVITPLLIEELKASSR